MYMLWGIFLWADNWKTVDNLKIAQQSLQESSRFIPKCTDYASFTGSHLMHGPPSLLLVPLARTPRTLGK